MSTVRFSKELTAKIIDNAKKKMEPAVIAAMGTKPDNSWGQRIYDMMFRDVKPYLVNVPREWLRTTDKIEIESVGGINCNMVFPLSLHTPWPVRPVTNELVKYSTWGNGVILTKHPQWDEFYVEVTSFNNRVEVASSRRDAFVDMVSQVIGAYSTLAPALKTWPPLWDLLPESVKDKHREIVERSNKKVKLEVDLNKLTAMSTAAKFGI